MTFGRFVVYPAASAKSILSGVFFVLPFRSVTALTEFSDQDITKLRRDVKIAFEDMTSQMNRYNSKYI
jgi:hypothetical protein